MSKKIIKIPLLTNPTWDGKHTLSAYYLEHSEVVPGEMIDWAINYPKEAFSEGQDMQIALEALEIFRKHWAEDD